MRIAALAVLLFLAAPALAAGQGAAPYDQAVRAAAALELAAQRSVASEAVHPLVADDVLAPRRHNRKSEGVTMMIVGGAAVVVGAIVGDSGGTILIVGGLVCAGYGFYLYTE